MILSNNNYHWSKIKRQVLSKCVFVELLTEIEVFDMSPTHRRVLTQALHPSSFHCCLSQDPPHVSVLFLSSVLGARVRELLWGSLPQKALWKERALSIKGRQQRSLSRCLVLPIVSSFGAKSLAHLALSFYIFHSQPLTCLRCESRKKCLRKKTPLRKWNGNRFIFSERKERSNGLTLKNRSLDTSG